METAKLTPEMGNKMDFVDIERFAMYRVAKMLTGLWAIALLVVMLSMVGCSWEALVRSDTFYKKGEEPREDMPWYNSVGGNSMSTGWRAEGFPKLGGGTDEAGGEK
tara:strand:- start:7990 stop:8307 length:318 start_codon:yes stop_codon:yes gene_type:complete